MILLAKDILKRRSNFLLDLFNSLPVEKIQEILGKEDKAIIFELRINGNIVPLTILEKMYSEVDIMVDIRAKYKAMKMIENLKYDLSEMASDSYKKLANEMDKKIMNYTNKIKEYPIEVEEINE